MKHYEVAIEFGTGRELVRFTEEHSKKETLQFVWNCLPDIEAIKIV